MKANLAVIRIRRGLLNAHLRAADFGLRGGLRKKRHVQIAFVMRVGHPLHLRQQTRHVARATGGAEPRRAAGGAVVEWILAVRRERVHVKEPVALEVHRGEHVVE